MRAFRLQRLVADRTQNLLPSEGKSFNQNVIPKVHSATTLAHPTQEMHTADMADGLIEQTAGPPRLSEANIML